VAWIGDVVVDCRHPASLARFWAAVLVESERERGPRLFFQLGPEATTVKNRLHLDLRCADVDGEVARMEGLGGRVRVTFDDHVVLVDPEGNVFCLQR
jgi:predicted enzyme related to lactoylglutathione lyase